MKYSGFTTAARNTCCSGSITSQPTRWDCGGIRRSKRDKKSGQGAGRKRKFLFPLFLRWTMQTGMKFGVRLAIACVIAAGMVAWHAAGVKHSAAMAESEAVLVGAGDIADCTDLSGAEATEKVLAKIPGTVMAIGGLAYPGGAAANFTCYDKTWGKEKSRTRPAPGNHEFHSAGAAYYFQYFGAAAGEASKGYYSYELGRWHIVVLNSECDQIGGCGAGLAQGERVRGELGGRPGGLTPGD